MFKYVKFTKVETDLTVLEFRASDDKVKVNHFDADVVSLESDLEADIDALISSQANEISCEVISHKEFKSMVKNSSQLKRIRQIVKEGIALRYDNSDEISMSKRSEDDHKRVAYDTFVREHLSNGYRLKSEIGY